MSAAEWTIVISLIALTITMVSHIFVIARWSGRVDARLEEILKQPTNWATDLTTTTASLHNEMTAMSVAFQAKLDVWTDEVKRLRDARHTADGKIQIHEGRLQAYDRGFARLDAFLDSQGRDPIERRK